MAQGDRPRITDALKGVDMFAGLRQSQLDALENACRLKKHPRGAVVVEEGNPGHSLYVVRRGRVGIRTTNELGEYVYVAERGEGECFGEMSLFDAKPRSHDAVALEDSEFLVLERADFLRCVASNSDIAICIITTLSERLREASALLSGAQTVRSRLAAKLLGLAQRKGTSDVQGRIRFRLDGTRQELAERVRSRRETISRELAAMHREGLISVRGREVCILDEARMRKLEGE